MGPSEGAVGGLWPLQNPQLANQPKRMAPAIVALKSFKTEGLYYRYHNYVTISYTPAGSRAT